MNPFRERILEYIKWQKAVRLDQLASARFVEDGYYNKDVCGSFESNLEELVKSGDIRRISFSVGNKVIYFLLDNDAKFNGWC